MPQNKFALARYRLIDTLLRSRSYVKTSEIAEYCRIRTGFSVSRRTIELDIQAMRFDDFLGFFAPITYHTGQKAYFYTDRSYRLYRPYFTAEEVEILKFALSLIRDKLTENQTIRMEEVIDRMEAAPRMAK